MLISILLCLSVTTLICAIPTNEAPTQYECGRHGRFEYCIDGTPDCVIGCHCHPGYYFDTETKICEPNVKLSENYRRLYVSNPNQLYALNKPTMSQNIPTQTTPNSYTEQVDEMSKDTDDIGEWLYNQFFKTIESQVINNSSNVKPTRRINNIDITTDKKINGRRSMNDIKPKNIKKKRKARKFSKGKSKQSKSKGHGLRRKLLRITEDDSLFDSESETVSDEGSSSGDGDSRTNSEIKSCEVNTKNYGRDHGHKKVVIFNRRPRPPLPSFIFLPNMDSPYYPPIGLPPPPALPMYPMIPVPPMAPYFPPIDKGNNCASTTATSQPDSTTETSVATSTLPVPEITTVNTTSGVGSRKTMRKSKYNRDRTPPWPPKSSEELFVTRSRNSDPRLQLTAKQLENMNLVNSLKERLKKRKKIQNSPTTDFFNTHEKIDLYGDIPTVPEPKQQHDDQTELEKTLKDVNFKYLSQLIHRLNNTESPLSAALTNTKHEKLLKSRRGYDQDIPFIHFNADDSTHPRSSVTKNQTDEYFTNLGRQIAALIRDEDAKLGYTSTAVPDAANSVHDSIVHSILNGNRYAPRSYWERFVRSPLSALKSYLPNLNFFDQDSEMNLFSLENEANIFAGTPTPLTLQDLENILSKEQNNNVNNINNYKFPKQSDISFNVNLLPKQNIQVDNIYRRKFDNSEPVNYSPEPMKTNASEYTRKVQINNVIGHLHPTNDDVIVARGPNINPLTRKLPNLHTKDNISRENAFEVDSERVNHSSKMPLKQRYVKNNSVPIETQVEYLKFYKKNPVILKRNENQSMLSKYFEPPPKYLTRPDNNIRYKVALYSHKPSKYFPLTRNNHHYMFEASYPLHIPSLKKRSEGVDTAVRPSSYFHHEFHHFDYMD